MNDTVKQHSAAMFSIVHHTIPPFVEQSLFLVGSGQVDEQFVGVFPLRHLHLGPVDLERHYVNHWE